MVSLLICDTLTLEMQAKMKMKRGVNFETINKFDAQTYK